MSYPEIIGPGYTRSRWVICPKNLMLLTAPETLSTLIVYTQERGDNSRCGMFQANGIWRKHSACTRLTVSQFITHCRRTAAIVTWLWDVHWALCHTVCQTLLSGCSHCGLTLRGTLGAVSHSVSDVAFRLQPLWSDSVNTRMSVSRFRCDWLSLKHQLTN